MEGISILEARQLFGDNFIGKKELKSFFSEINLPYDNIIEPSIQYTREQLEQCASDYILILGVSSPEITIRSLRSHYGLNPDNSEPCFYNQDWYLSEDFIDNTLETKWYLLKKDVIEDSRAVMPLDLTKSGISFPSAILCTYAFFAFHHATGKYLWWHDFVWCSDLDHNGDRIYAGKYHDIDGVNKNGFSVHRHLALRPCYGAVIVK